MNRTALALALPLWLAAPAALADPPRPDAAPAADQEAPRLQDESLQNVFVPPRPIVEALDQPPAQNPGPAAVKQGEPKAEPARKHPVLFSAGVATVVTGTLVFVGGLMGYIFERTDQTTQCNQLLGDSAAQANCQADDQRGIKAGAAAMVVGSLLVAASVPMMVIGGQRSAPVAIDASVGPGSAALRVRF